jgi:pSer/pThr/pTyr-binding forkhead associated (FHA) protein
MLQKESPIFSYYEMIVTTYEGPHANFYTIKDKITPIGRASHNAIIVMEESACKIHAEIIMSCGKFFIKDLGSDSGTFIKVFGKE